MSERAAKLPGGLPTFERRPVDFGGYWFDEYTCPRADCEQAFLVRPRELSTARTFDGKHHPTSPCPACFRVALLPGAAEQRLAEAEREVGL